jgi:hypothetical protein
MNKSSNKTFAVLGMHRSATSLVAGGLDKRGVNMGENLLPADAGNPEGYYENVEFMNLNQRILSAAGGSWKNVPDREDILSVEDQFTDAIQRLVTKHQDDLWGFKDPRTTLTIELFLPYLENPHFITCFREPEEVGKSLKRRDGMDVERGKELADTYNSRVLDFLQRWTGV